MNNPNIVIQPEENTPSAVLDISKVAVRNSLRITAPLHGQGVPFGEVPIPPTQAEIFELTTTVD